MELNFDSLNITGYHNQPVPNTSITHTNPTTHAAVILPGYRFSADMPPLHYTRRILLEQGADILSVDYTYYRTDFMRRPESEQDQWISADIFAACNALLSRHPYEKITLVGKSLGTIAMGHLLADRRFQQAVCIWLTPLLTADWLRARIEQIHPRSLFIIGTADQFYRPDILEHLETVTNGRSVVIKDANHALEIQGDIQQSILALNQMTQAVQAFLQEGL
jgi:pimeloyl-ACP methyl ester carboxylesterase